MKQEETLADIIELVKLAMVKDLASVRFARETVHGNITGWKSHFFGTHNGQSLRAHVDLDVDGNIEILVNGEYVELDELVDMITSYPDDPRLVAIPFRTATDIMLNGVENDWDMRFNRESEKQREYNLEHDIPLVSVTTGLSRDNGKDLTEDYPIRSVMIYEDGYLRGQRGIFPENWKTIVRDIDSPAPHIADLLAR